MKSYRKQTAVIILITCLIVSSCNNGKETPQPAPPPTNNALYFPPVSGTEWQGVQPDSLGWNTLALNDLYTYLQSKDTKAFIILKNGKIASEKYFGTFTADSNWYWASAGKTLTAFLTGIAQEEGIIDISKPTSAYIGTGWTTEPADKEKLITVKNQLTMTTGLDDGVADPDCTLPQCLIYKAGMQEQDGLITMLLIHCLML